MSRSILLSVTTNKEATASAASYRRGYVELHILLRRGILTKERAERAKQLADRFGIEIEVKDADPKKGKYSYYRQYAVSIKPSIVVDSEPVMAQASLFEVSA